MTEKRQPKIIKVNPLDVRNDVHRLGAWEPAEDAGLEPSRGEAEMRVWKKPEYEAAEPGDELRLNAIKYVVLSVHRDGDTVVFTTDQRGPVPVSEL